MARSQTWTRNISKKSRKPAILRSIVNDDALEGLKRRLEDVGLILHAQPGRAPQPKQASKKKGRGK
jgi:hypothetical protein